jgi:hypothetical protein
VYYLYFGGPFNPLSFSPGGLSGGYFLHGGLLNDMKQEDFNKLDASQIHLLLRRHPDTSTAQEAAVALLGPDARSWWSHRAQTPVGRIVDPETGKWKTPFTANGQRYHIISPEEGIGIDRYSRFKQMVSVVGFNATYNEQLEAFQRMIAIYNRMAQGEKCAYELGVEIENMRRAISKADKNFDYAFYAATLFIMRDGEKSTDTWSEALANDKIADWAAEGLLPEDFFLLVMLRASSLNEWWKKLPRYLKAKYPALFSGGG